MTTLAKLQKWETALRRWYRFPNPRVGAQFEPRAGDFGLTSESDKRAAQTVRDRVEKEAKCQG